MRSKLLTFGATVVLALGAPAAADTASPDATQPEAAAPAKRTTTLGPVVLDENGREGRIHEVQPGDTLWDISDAYLGTPWVWPSVWGDNTEIQNPHLIHPGEKLWIGDGEIRRLTDEEAAAMLAGADGAVPASLADGMDSAAMRYRVAEIETVGFVTAAQLEGAATIVDSHVKRVWLGDHDEVLIGLGEGEVQVGDRLEIFRRGPSVKNPETRLPIGWEVTVLGWLEVTEIHPETSTAIIRLSRDEIRRGDHVIAKPDVHSDITVAGRPDVDGSVIHTPHDRFEVAQADVVYLNRGATDGLEVGSPLEVFRPVGTAWDTVKREERQLPDEVVGKLLVVATTPDTATAVVTAATTEINPGDRFRGSDSIGW